VNASASVAVGEEEGNPYIGWLVGLALSGLVIVIGAGLWIHYHGL
jgi:hypothetical protein